MKKFLTLCGIIAAVAPIVYAQTPAEIADNVLFEEAVTRYEEPRTNVYVVPQIADMEMLSSERKIYGPYRFQLGKSGTLSEYDLYNFKCRALYRATIEADADLMIAPLYDSYITQGEDRVLVVELSGYPAKFVNFRPMPLDAETVNAINTCYPTFVKESNALQVK